jgi:hypothetical protein
MITATDVDAVLDDPAIHPPGRNRGNGHPAQHLPVTIGGDEPVPRELRRVEGLPAGRRGLEGGQAGVQPGRRGHRAAEAGMSGGWSWGMRVLRGGFGVSRRAGRYPPAHHDIAGGPVTPRIRRRPNATSPAG